MNHECAFDDQRFVLLINALVVWGLQGTEWDSYIHRWR